MNPIDAVDELLIMARDIIADGPCAMKLHGVFSAARHIHEIVSNNGDIDRSCFVSKKTLDGIVVFYCKNNVEFIFATGGPDNESQIDETIFRTISLIDIQRILVKQLVVVRTTKFAEEITMEIIRMLAAINEFCGFSIKKESLDVAEHAIKSGDFGEMISAAAFETIMIANIMSGMVHDDDMETISAKAVAWRNHFTTDAPDENFLTTFKDTITDGGSIFFYLSRANINAMCLFTDSDDAALIIMSHIWLCDCFNVLHDKYSKNMDDVITTIGGL